MTECLLGIDNGGTVAKAALFATDGRELGAARRKIELEMPQAGWREIDAGRLWQATAEVIRQVMAETGAAAADVAGVACTGHGNGLYLVDERGRPTRKGISSSDGRALAYVQQWEAGGVIDRVRQKTLQANWPAQPNALLRWLVDHEPGVLASSRWALMCKDYIRMRLTGEGLAELTDYSATSLMDVESNRFDDGVFEAFQIGPLRRLMPPLIRCTDRAGAVTAEAAAETGLAEGTPVFGGAFDIDACGLAAGCVDEASLVMVGGTRGTNQHLTRKPLRTRDVFMVSRYAIDDYYLVLEGSATSASNLEWFVDRFVRGACGPGEDPYEMCSRLVAECEAAEECPTFLPFLYGSPVSPLATGALVGLTGQTSLAAVVRAVFEGVGFMHHWHYDRLMQYRGAPEAIRMTGGVARSEVWCQMFADIFGLPVEVPRASELGALGAAMIAAVGLGIYPDLAAASSAMTGIARRHDPDTANHGVYQARYRRFQETIEAMKPLWK
jgi:L-xylulokinase